MKLFYIPLFFAFSSLMLMGHQNNECKDDEKEPETEVTTSACVSGNVRADIEEAGGGGYTPPGASNYQAPGARTVNGFSTNIFSSSPRSTIVPLRAGVEYRVKWDEIGSPSVSSIHAKFRPRNIPAGYQFQVNKGDGNGWVNQTRMDQSGAASLSNLDNVIHKFRLLPPVSPAGDISELTLSQTTFKTRPNQATNGRGIVGVNDNGDSLPDYQLPEAKLTISLGATEQSGSEISAGYLVFKRSLWVSPLDDFDVKPILLSYEAPAGIDTEVITDANQNIRQIKAPELLANVVTVSGSQFEVRLYPPSQIGTQPSPGQPYSVTGNPTRKVVFKKINISGYDHGVRMTEFEGGSQIDQVDFGGEYGNNGFQVFKSVRIEGGERTEVENRILWYSLGQQISVGGFTHTVTTEPLYYRDETTEVTRGGTLVGKSIKRYLLHSVGGWGFGSAGGFGELLYEEKDYSTSGSYEATQYWTNLYLHATLTGTNQAAIGKLALVTYPDGSWERYVYDDNGAVAKVYRPYLDSPATPMLATDTNCRSESFGRIADPYALPGGPAPQGFLDALKELPETREQNINGILAEKQSISYSSGTVGGEPTLTQTTKNYSNATTFIEDKVETYHQTASESLRGKLASRTYPSGKKMTYSYEKGTFNVSTRIFTPLASGKDMRVSITEGTTANPSGIANKTTREQTIQNSDGRTCQRTTQIYTGGTTYESATVTDYFYDNTNRLIRTEQDGRIIEEISYNGLVTTTTDARGTVRVTTLDDLERTSLVTETDAPNTSYDYTAPLSTVMTRGALTQTLTVDLLGRSTSQTGTDGVTTTTTYPNGGRDQQMTYPGSKSVRTESYKDGTPKNTTNTSGSRVVQQYHTHNVLADGKREQTTRLSTSSSPRYTKTQSDWLGRETRYERPAPSKSGVVTTDMTYHPNGQIASETYSANQNLATHLREYDTMGDLVREGTDLNNNGTLDLNSSDRITEYDRHFEKIGNEWYRVEETKVYRQNNNTTASSQGISKTRLHANADGLSHKAIRLNPDGLTVTTETVINRATRQVTVTTTRSDASQPTIRIYSGNLLESEESPTAHRTYQYDSQQRLWKTTDERTGTVTERLYNAQGLLSSVRVGNDPAATYDYYPANDFRAGLLKTVTNPLGKTTHFDYNDKGQTTKTWGQASYPTWRAYNSYGELTTLRTYRAGTGWENATWPTGNEGTADLTTWDRHEATSLLNFKEDAQTRRVTYTWRDNGLVHTKKNSRNITATHSYTNTGQLSDITYTDSTPSVSHTYTRDGQPHVTTDVSGTHTRAYTTTGLTDTITSAGSGTHAGLSFDYDHLHQGKVSKIKVNKGGSVLYNLDFTYHPDSARVHTLTRDGHTATYHYLKQSPHIQQITLSSAGNASYINSRAYDSHNRLMATTWSQHSNNILTPKDHFGYEHDALNRRTTRTQLGGIAWDYGYNDRNEVNLADKKQGTAFISGQQYRFSFDNIGNRTSKETGGDASGNNRRTTTETPNSLNQYTSRTTPNSIDVLGKAPAATAVTVNGQNTTRQGELFHRNLTVNNSGSNGIWQNITASGGGQSESGHRYIPPANFTPSYDLDGNLTDDGEWLYEWDAENRLIKATRTARSQAAGAPYRRIEYQYDAQHRRISRKEYHNTGSTANSTELYLYDGWNRILTLNASQQSIQSFTWGIDLSNSFQGAGGVGGLLWIEDHTSGDVHYAASDGNGNIANLYNPDTQEITARYEYSPFGETVRAYGSYAETNRFRFSSKSEDSLTKNLYYGYRSLKPSWSKWMSKDPLGEEGGVNLYGFVENESVNGIDYLGLALYAFDGTWNDRRKMKNPTNVWKLWRVYKDAKFYYKGVGTNWHTKHIGGLTGAGGKNRIRKAYKDLVKQVKKGDCEIDIIGFSRGAAQARDFANLIRRKGVKIKGKKIKLRVRFLGLFDTVASHGIPGNNINIGYDLKVRDHIDYVAHATANDERRHFFPLHSIHPRRGQRNTLKRHEKGFPGAHSNVGGGYPNNDLSDGALLWMWKKGVAAKAPFGPLPAEQRVITHGKKEQEGGPQDPKRRIFYP